jgi:hypothetical protein
MTNHTELIDRYLATWNESNADRRKQLIEQTWTPDGVYLDPLIEAKGRDRIDAMIYAVQRKYAGLRFRRSAPVDGFNDQLRFSWELVPETGHAVIGGTDFAVVQGALLRAVTGFIDFAPKPGEN